MFTSTASTELLKQLHWPPIEWRIRFKLAYLVHKILNTGHPPYLTISQAHKVHTFIYQSLTFCSATQVHTTSHLVLAVYTSLRPKYGTAYLFTSANPKHTLPSDVILRRTIFFQPISPPSGPCTVP